MRLTVLIPSLNEREGIAETIRTIPVDQLQGGGHAVQVLVVDGASTDGTPEIAHELGATVVTEPRKGYGRAYKTGFAKVQGDVVATADADGTYPLDDLPRFLEEFRSRGLDFATVNRFAELRKGSMSLKHRFGNRVLTVTARVVHRVRIEDSQSGMWILGRRALDALPYEAFSDGMAFSQEVKIAAFRHAGLKAAELQGRYYARHGDAKLGSWRDGLGNLRRLVFRRLPRSPPGKGSR